MQVTLYKLGGSLLQLPDLADRLQSLLDRQQPERAVLIVGGGEVADVVRAWHERFDLTEEAAHWLAIQSLNLNNQLLLQLLPATRLVTTPAECIDLWPAGITPVLNVEAYLRREEDKSNIKLPHCWQTTSDSIAAWIAMHWPADKLVLLKSTTLPMGCDGAEAARQELVDSHFTQFAQQLATVTWINLREAQPVEQDFPQGPT